ncbi:MAG: FecR domain-containing protein [Pseudohongiellaceae bacterium]
MDFVYTGLKTTKTCLLIGLLLTNACLSSEATTRLRTAGRVVDVTGDATAKDTFSESRPLYRRDTILPGDTVSTASTSNVQLRMNDSALIVLGCDSSLKLEKYQFEKDHNDIVELELLQGSIRTLTGYVGSQNRDGYKFTVEGIEIEVQGTDFEVHRQADGNVYFGNYGGSIAIKNSLGSLDLGIGHNFDFAIAEPEQAPRGLKNPPQVFLDNALSFLTPLTQPTFCNQR